MSAFFARRKWLLSALTGLVVCVVGFEVWARWLTAVPLDIPVALSSAGKIDREVQVRRDCRHSLEFAFSIGTRDREEVGVLLGAFRPRNSGSNKTDTQLKIPVKWSIADMAGNVVGSGEGDTSEGNGWTSTEFSRSVSRAFALPHGRYRLSVVLLRDVPETHGMSARLRFWCHNGKVSSGWQDDLLFFGQLVEHLIIVPLAAILAAILLGLETRHLGPRHASKP